MRPALCYVASYDPGYARNVDVIRAFERAGAWVEVAGGRLSQPARRGKPSLAGAILGQLARKAFLPFDVGLRLLRCRALVVGYFGQPDMLLLAPLARALGRPVIFNPLVTLTDTLIEDRKLASPDGPLAALIRLADRMALRLADVILVDTAENRAFVARRFGIDPSRVVVMPVGVDERIFHPDGSPASDHDGQIDVLFYGKFIPLHGAETIVRAAAIVKQRCRDVRFELIGTGQDYQRARRLATKLGVQRIQWTDWLPYEALGERLRAADIALGVFSGGTKAGRVIPNKVHQALACGVPVVTRRSPAVERLLVDGESALLVPPDDPEALADAILRLASDREMRREIGARGRQAWLGQASEVVLTGVAGDVLRRVGLAC